MPSREKKRTETDSPPNLQLSVISSPVVAFWTGRVRLFDVFPGFGSTEDVVWFFTVGVAGTGDHLEEEVRGSCGGRREDE